MARYVVGVSGASGTVLAYKTCLALGEQGHAIELVMSKAACYTARTELGPEFATPERFVQKFPENIEERITLHSNHDVGAPICSGSYSVDAMLIVPCSMATVAAIACGLGDNCLRRAADVTLKERRPLLIVPRETPLSSIHLENMLRLTQAGATLVPPIPAWYTNAPTLDAQENFMVGKLLDLLHLKHSLYTPWKALPLQEAFRVCSKGEK